MALYKYFIIIIIIMRWALAIQEFDVTFRIRKDSTDVVADCLSGDVLSGDDGM